MAALPTLTATYSGFVNSDTSASLATQVSLSTSATASSRVAGSPYTITASGAVDSDYTISYVAGSLTVTKAPLTITANNQTKIYAAVLPTLTATYTGLVNGDTAANLTSPPTLTTTATSASHVLGSPYTITASGAVDTDYTISYVAGGLTVTPAALTIAANTQNKTYGAVVPTLTASYSGFVNGDTSANLTSLPILTTTATASSSVSGNPYPITASGAAGSDYTISYVSGSLYVMPAALTITADNQTMAYGGILADSHSALHGAGQRRYPRNLFVRGQHATDHQYGPGNQPRRHLCHRGIGRERCQLHNLVCERHVNSHTDRADYQCKFSIENLRRRGADAHRVLLGFRQWRHHRISHYPTNAEYNRDLEQPCHRQPIHHHRKRCVG